MRALVYLLFLGCVIAYTNYPTREVDPKLVSYETDYLFKIDAYCPHGISEKEKAHRVIKFEDLKSPTIGLCARGLFRSTLSIDKTYWMMADLVQRQALFEHEQGHCVLGLEHSDNPKSYMYFQANEITLDELNEQVKADIKRKCL